MDEKFNNMDDDNLNDNKETGENPFDTDDSNFDEVSEDVSEEDIVITPKKEEVVIRKKTTSNKKKKRKKKKRSVASGIILVSIILAISVILSTAIIVFSSDVLGFGGSTDDVTIVIPKGTSISKTAEMLKEKNIISHPKLFTKYCRLNDKDLIVYPGEHTLKDSMSYNDIIKKLKVPEHQDKDLIKIMFPEGITLQEAAEKLENNGICSASDFIHVFNKQYDDLDFDKLVPDGDLKFYRMEGYFFPDTYQFYKNSTPEYVCQIIKTTYSQKVYSKYYAEIKKQGLTLDQVMTMASMVQREAPTKEDMEKVASVFWNRLNDSKNHPMLQSDPTTKYVTETIKPNIMVPNEKIFTAYDTYKGQGLPPGAICNPGVEAIEAVLHPAKTDYYYFCSNLKTKKFYYSKTLAQHEINLRTAGLR